MSEDEGGDDGAIKSWIKETAKEKLSSLIGGDLMKKIGSIASAVTVSAWWKAAKTFAKGAKLVVDAIGSATKRFVDRWGHKLKAEGSGQNESYRRGRKMKITKRQLRRIIKEALLREWQPGMDPDPSGLEVRDQVTVYVEEVFGSHDGASIDAKKAGPQELANWLVSKDDRYRLYLFGDGIWRGMANYLQLNPEDVYREALRLDPGVAGQ